jgi:dTDP-4-dehydrorhamnose reductase
MERILLLGGSGILGTEIHQVLQNENMEYLAPTSSDLDIRNRYLLVEFLYDFRPTWVINCAAWTNVDGAEDLFEEACELNVSAVENIAEGAAAIGCKVIHISTDYVFDGESEIPYGEDSQVSPLNKYGESKLKGETVLQGMLSSSYVVRTSWLYGVSGKNFVKTIAGKALRHEQAKVVDDQVGSPTNAKNLAAGIISIIRIQPPPGVYNYSNEGSCSWLDLARAIYKNLGASPELVEANDSATLNLKARRPKFSLLNKEKWKMAGLSEVPNWDLSLKSALPEIVAELKDLGGQ